MTTAMASLATQLKGASASSAIIMAGGTCPTNTVMVPTPLAAANRPALSSSTAVTSAATPVTNTSGATGGTFISDGGDVSL